MLGRCVVWVLSLLRTRKLVLCLVPIIAAWTSPACAFLDPPYITPANPTSGDPVVVNIYGGGCDLVDDALVWLPPVTQQGNAITILFTGIHEGDPEWCYYGVGTATYPVGTFPAGSYTLDVERRYGTPFGTWAQETLGVIPFTVTGVAPAQPLSAPTLSMAGLASLLLLLIGAAVRALNARARWLR